MQMTSLYNRNDEQYVILSYRKDFVSLRVLSPGGVIIPQVFPFQSVRFSGETVLKLDKIVLTSD